MNNSGVECGAIKEMAEKIVNVGGNLALKIQPERLIRETCVRAGEAGVHEGVRSVYHKRELAKSVGKNRE